MIKKLLCIFASAILMFNITAFADTKKPYQVEVNRAQNYVSVFAPDEAGEYTVNVKNFICSTGPDTPDGTFRTSDKYTWRYLFGDVYGQYATRVTGHILFHSVPYYTQNKNDLEYEEYNKLGTSASMGCIRLTAEDAKWIYDNCPSGTTVKIYYNQNSAVPQYKQPVKIDVADLEKRGWDPTDPDANNPWKKAITETPTSVANKIYVINGSTNALKSFIIDGENYIHIKDSGKFFDGVFVSKETAENVTFKKFNNHRSTGNSILTYLFKPSYIENKTVNAEFNNSTYTLEGKNINGYTFIKFDDAVKIFGAKVSEYNGKTIITY